MKKFFLLLPLLAITLLSFAGMPDEADPLTQQAFKKQFAGAESVNWTKIDGGFMKVAFSWNGHRTEAYFNSNAELVGSARIIFYDQLPMSVSRGIERSFPQGVTLEITEIYMDDVTSYSIVIEQGNRKYKARFNSFGQWTEKERLKK